MTVKSLLIATVLTVGSSGAAGAQTYLMFGIGGESCATWLNAGPAPQRLGEEFIAGLWTGLNLGSTSGSRMIGQSTDAQGKVGEIRRYCSGAPSTAIVDATIAVWKDFLDQGR